MSTVETRAANVHVEASRSGFGRVLMAEWSKFTSVRSTLGTLAASAALSIGLGAGLLYAHLDFWAGMDLQERASVDAVSESLMGLWIFGLLGFAVVGALSMTSEYSTGTIRATFAAMPRRLHVLSAKAIVVGLTTFTVATLTSFALFFVAQPILAQESMDVSIGDSGVLFAVLGGGIYVAVASLAGLALGTIIRGTTGTLVAVTSIFFLAGIFIQVQPESWESVTRFLPNSAGVAVMSTIDQSYLLSPGVGLIALLGWVSAAFVAAAVLLERRDTEA